MLNTEILTRDQFLQKAALRDQEFRSYEVKDARLRDSEWGRQIVLNDEIVARNNEFSEVANFLGAPVGFLKTTHLDLADQIVQRLSRDSGEKEILLKGTKIITHRPKKGPHIPASQVCQKILSSVPEVEKTIFFDLEKYFDAQIICHSLETKPKVNDIIRGGLRFLYSEFMFKEPSMSTFSERLVCLNGMTHSDSQVRFEFESVEKLLRDLEKTTAFCLEYFKTTADSNFKKAVETKAAGDQIIRRAFSRNRLHSRFYDSVLAAHAIENDGSAYGVIQAFTRAANEQINYTNRSFLQEVGGNELSTVSRAHCSACYAELN